jgi:mRNA interferase RelE/StbE
LAWTIEFEERAERDLSTLDKSIQREILRYLEIRIANSHDPRAFGHALSHNLSGLWRYRVRDYRIVCKLEQDCLIVLVVAIGHRSQVYK